MAMFQKRPSRWIGYGRVGLRGKFANGPATAYAPTGVSGHETDREAKDITRESPKEAEELVEKAEETIKEKKPGFI